jgi:hypothetical protein
MRFFFDNNLSIRIAKAIAELEDREKNTVVHIREKYDQAMADVEWISRLGSEGGWIVLSCDRNIMRNPHERKAWEESGLTIFFIKENFKNLPFWDQSWQLIKRWPSIKEQAAKNPKSAQFVLSLTGTKIEKIS